MSDTESTGKCRGSEKSAGQHHRRFQVQIRSPALAMKLAKRTPAGFLLLAVDVTLRAQGFAGLFAGPRGHAERKNASAFQALRLGCPSGSGAELLPAGEGHRMHESVATDGALGGHPFLYCHCSFLIGADAHYEVLLGNSLRSTAALGLCRGRAALWRNHGECLREHGGHMVVEAMTRTVRSPMSSESSPFELLRMTRCR